MAWSIVCSSCGELIEEESDDGWGTSPRHKSALIFGGRVKYERREYQQQDGTFDWEAGLRTQAFAMKEEVHVVLSDGSTCREDEIAVACAEAGSPVPVTYAGGKNKGEYKTKKVKVPAAASPSCVALGVVALDAHRRVVPVRHGEKRCKNGCPQCSSHEFDLADEAF